MATFISSERRDAVALVTIDNPPMNALSAALLDELEAELQALDADDGVRAIVLRGAGEKAFVAGADIKEFPSLRESAAEGGSARGIQRLGQRMDAARTPFVAAIRGFCLGGGLELAMCCDVRICADDATLGQPEIKLGLIPGGGGTQRLPRLVGIGRAMFLNLTGDFVDAETAYAWGLVEKVVRRRSSRTRRSRSRAGSRRNPPTRSPSSASWRGRPVTCRSRRGCGVRQTGSSAASAPGTAPRASRRSSRSARPPLPGGIAEHEGGRPRRGAPARASRAARTRARRGQTLVEVRAAGVNYADVLIREGRYPQSPPLPFVPGSEIAGETPDGRRVIGFVRADGGGYAERAVAEDDWLFDLPDGASFEEGAAFLLAFLTAWIPLTRQVRIERGSRVLVTAAAGGVGSAGLQVASALGAEVVGAVGSPEKLEHVRSLGAQAVTYEDVAALDPFDVILDQVGGDLFAAALRSLTPLGTIVGVGFAAAPGSPSIRRCWSAGTHRWRGSTSAAS